MTPTKYIGYKYTIEIYVCIYLIYMHVYEGQSWKNSSIMKLLVCYTNGSINFTFSWLITCFKNENKTNLGRVYKSSTLKLVLYCWT